MVESVDTGDLKSPGGDTVRVRVPSTAPKKRRGKCLSFLFGLREDEKELEPIVKAADKLSAHIKCLEEQKAGNTEFDSAAKQTWDAMKAMALPELDWFLEHCLAPFSMNLDELK